jgi:hypothetical protein
MTPGLTSSILLPLLITALVTACSDDGNGDDVDAMAIDAMAPPDASPPDGPSGPFPCASATASCTEFPPPEGGEFRLERFQTGPNDGDAELAAQAFFFEDQEPPFRPLSATPIALREGLTNLGYTCGDFRSGYFFENGNSFKAQQAVISRTYFDVGATAKLTSAEDGAEVITLDRFLATDDPAAATDRSAGLVHDVLYKAPESTPVQRNARYLPAITGSDDYPMLDLKFGEAALSEDLADENGNGTPQIFMPSAFTLRSPAEADFYTDGALVFIKGEDFEITYTPAGPAPADFPTIIPFIRFVNDLGVVEASCIKATPGLPENGRFTVPSEVLDIVQAGPGSRVVFGRLIHAAWYTPTPTRMDLIGIESKVSPGFVIEDAKPARR